MAELQIFERLIFAQNSCCNGYHRLGTVQILVGRVLRGYKKRHRVAVSVYGRLLDVNPQQGKLPDWTELSGRRARQRGRHTSVWIPPEHV